MGISADELHHGSKAGEIILDGVMLWRARPSFDVFHCREDVRSWIMCQWTIRGVTKRTIYDDADDGQARTYIRRGLARVVHDRRSMGRALRLISSQSVTGCVDVEDHVRSALN